MGGSAHRKGSFTRPQAGNILMTKETRRPKVADFGLAKLSAPIPDSPRHRSSSDLQATCLPSNVRQGREIGTASDLYALGAIRSELLTGSRPQFRAGRSRHVAASQNSRTVSPRAARAQPGARYRDDSRCEMPALRIKRSVTLGDGTRRGPPTFRPTRTSVARPVWMCGMKRSWV